MLRIMTCCHTTMVRLLPLRLLLSSLLLLLLPNGAPRRLPLALGLPLRLRVPVRLAFWNNFNSLFLPSQSTISPPTPFSLINTASRHYGTLLLPLLLSLPLLRPLRLLRLLLACRHRPVWRLPLVQMRLLATYVPSRATYTMTALCLVHASMCLLWLCLPLLLPPHSAIAAYATPLATLWVTRYPHLYVVYLYVSMSPHVVPLCVVRTVMVWRHPRRSVRLSR